MALSQQQIDAFWQDGFLSYGSLLKGEELELYRREYDRELSLADESGKFRNLSADEGASVAVQKAAPQKMLQMMQMCQRNIHYRALIHDERILDVVADLIGPNIMLFHDQALYKPPFHGGEVNWHQDNGYWRCRPASLVSCWLTLDDVDADNGAMQLIPGSHLAPVWHEKKRQQDILFDLQDKVDVGKAVTIDLPAGGCMFHHCQTLHHTNPNTTPRQRRAFAIHFMPLGTRHGEAGEILHPSFARPVLRLSV